MSPHFLFSTIPKPAFIPIVQVREARGCATVDAWSQARTLLSRQHGSIGSIVNCRQRGQL